MLEKWIGAGENSPFDVPRGSAMLKTDSWQYLKRKCSVGLGVMCGTRTILRIPVCYQGKWVDGQSKGDAFQTCKYMKVAKLDIEKNNIFIKVNMVLNKVQKGKKILLIKCYNLPFP